jgi:hypothetical protein
MSKHKSNQPDHPIWRLLRLWAKAVAEKLRKINSSRPQT